MEIFYNPDLMPDTEIKRTFVGREWLMEDLLSILRSQPDGAGVQHVVIIGPRGMGKTTVLLMTGFSVRDGGLTEQWQAVRFREETYSITDLADFWMEVLQHLAAETQDPSLLASADRLKEENPDSAALQEAAFSLLKDWRKSHNKRLLLLVDNFDMILGQINDEQENARLRNVLMNDGTLMLLGAATTFFREARAYDQPLYNFFRIFNLESLDPEQIKELLTRRASADGLQDFEEKLRTNATRLRALQYFTGGNPRLVLMLYRVVAGSAIAEVRRGLEKLLDEVTPYYQGKMERLSPQQRKILDHIARLSGRTSEGQTPTDIASATRMTPNQVSAQLQRLAEEGYVRALNLRGRRSYYALSEPLFAIWYQMRFGRVARQRMHWLVDFLKAWYDARELGAEGQRLNLRFEECIAGGLLPQARETLELRSYFAEAADDPAIRRRLIENVISGYLKIGDTEPLRRDILSGISLDELSAETVQALCEKGCIKPDEIFGGAIPPASEETERRRAELILRLEPKGSEDWKLRGRALGVLEHYEEALESFKYVVELTPEDAGAWKGRGLALFALGRYKESLACYEQAVARAPEDAKSWKWRGQTLTLLERYEEALESFERAVERAPEDAEAWRLHGWVLVHLKRREEALASFERALSLCAHDAIADRLNILLGRLLLKLIGSDVDSAKLEWGQVVQAVKLSEKRQDLLSQPLLILARSGLHDLTRSLITESGLEEQLFPLARALDYLQTGDKTLIEKLSPEVRGIVDEIVADLQSSNPKEKPRESGSEKPPQPRGKPRKRK